MTNAIHEQAAAALARIAQAELSDATSDDLTIPLAIECGRLEGLNAKISADLEKARDALNNVQVVDEYGTLYIGVAAAGGCWSSKIEQGGRDIFEAWQSQRDAALAPAEKQEGE